jgi:CRISPR/Cas system CSM-associated protein Csm2 small subunit
MDNEYKKIREQKYKAESKDRLSKVLKKKIQTTMIGALSTIEENLAFLWEQDNTKFSKEDMKNLYNKIRSEILDKGNNQARNIDAELSQYDVEWLKYSVKIPFVQQQKN